MTSYQDNNASGTPKDNWTTNIRDAGLRVVLPGGAGTRNIYHVRVRSSSTNLNNRGRAALTSGNYELQIRLQETDELAGSTVRYADIRYADYGIQVRGMPMHSPLTGEATEIEGNNDGPGAAEQRPGSGQPAELRPRGDQRVRNDDRRRGRGFLPLQHHVRLGAGHR